MYRVNSSRVNRFFFFFFFPQDLNTYHHIFLKAQYCPIITESIIILFYYDYNCNYNWLSFLIVWMCLSSPNKSSLHKTLNLCIFMIYAIMNDLHLSHTSHPPLQESEDPLWGWRICWSGAARFRTVAPAVVEPGKLLWTIVALKRL